MLAAAGFYVACFLSCHFDRVEGLLPGASGSLGCLSVGHGPYASGSQSLGGFAGGPSCCCSGGGSYFNRGQVDGDPSQPSGASLSGCQEESLPSGRWSGRELDGSKPLGSNQFHSYTPYYFTEFTEYQCHGDQDEVHPHPGPGGRDGVCSGLGSYQGSVGPEIHRFNWWASMRRVGAYQGATECTTSENPPVGKSTLRGLCRVHSVWKEDVSGLKIPYLHSEPRWRFLDEGDPRSVKLHPVVGKLSSVEGGHGDVGCIPIAVLQQYEVHIERLVKLYSGCWHLVVSADDKARSDHLARLQLKVSLDHQAGRAVPVGWDSKTPSWGPVFRLLLDHNSFWAENVHNPALVWLAHGSKGPPRTPSEQVATLELHGGEQSLKADKEAAQSQPGSTTPTRKQQANRDRRDARKKRLKADREELSRFRNDRGSGSKGKGKGRGGGEQLCYAWNNGNPPCGGLAPGAACQGESRRPTSAHLVARRVTLRSNVRQRKKQSEGDPKWGR